ncbi:MAG: NusG domain II-containing protein [Dethiosulfatibacter sp.]|nr:NusG domain II-containing protein [Dethiosulfatibacter sp.]
MTKYDKILIFIVLIASILGIIAVNSAALNYNNLYAEIIINNELYKKYTLGYGVDEEITVESAYGKNVIHVDNDHVYMQESDCPDQICVQMPQISEPGEIIVCLPNRLIIIVTGESGSIDTITH